MKYIKQRRQKKGTYKGKGTKRKRGERREHRRTWSMKLIPSKE